MPEVNADQILNWIKERVAERKADFDPHFWMDVGLKLTILLPDEIAKLYDLQRVVAQKRLDIFSTQDKRNVSEARLIIEATEEYRDMRKQEAKIKQIEELVRLAKLQARVNAGQ
jgi:hypothetical protein